MNNQRSFGQTVKSGARSLTLSVILCGLLMQPVLAATSSSSSGSSSNSTKDVGKRLEECMGNIGSSGGSSGGGGGGGYPVMDIGRAMAIIAGWMTERGQWSSIIQKLSTQADKLVDLDQLLYDEFEKYDKVIREEVAVAINDAIRVTNKKEWEVTQAINDNKAVNMRLAAALQNSLENVAPTNEYACKVILGQQLTVTAEELEREGTDFITRSIMALGRTKTSDANGPTQTRLQRKFMCDGKYANPVTGDTDCIDSSKKTTDGYKLAGGTEQPPTIGRKLVMSTLSGSGATRTFDPKTNDERAYVQAIKYIQDARGSHTTALWGKNMMTPIGRLQRSLKNHALATAAVLIRQPAGVVSYTTRPNCNEEGSKELCKKQEERCNAATENLIDKDKIIDGCKKGVSPYEADLLAHLMCKSDQHAVFQAASGSTFGEQMQTIKLCDMAWDSFMEYVQVKENVQNRAIMAMGKLDALEASVDALGSGAYTAQIEQEENALRRYTALRQAQKAETKITPINTAPVGRILSADEIQWPETIGQ